MAIAASVSNDLKVLRLPTNATDSIDYTRELAIVTASIQDPLSRVESLIQSQLIHRDEEVNQLLKYISEMGGKRLRPALVLLSAQAVGGIDDETIRLAAVVELVHTATLVHDDVLDNADTRRHRPTLHQLTDRHSSILVGDWLFTQAYALANEGDSTIPGRWIAQAAKQVCEGEIRQNLAIGQSELSLNKYLAILGQKTGSLCAISCQLGAWSAGGASELCKTFFDFGWKLGTAFQVHDDWLDYWGSEDRLGKPIGSDLASGKRTLPIIRLLDVACDNERAEILDLLSQRTTTAIFQARKLLDRYQIGEYTRQVARQLSRDAIDLIGRSNISLGREYLERLAIAAVERVA
ncbi:MAG: polyprenyl synthetase family protein [Pirellulaceae bacterium]|nr:polyprenyl synthetase family protein [Pirellulaceae bacterium]